MHQELWLLSNAEINHLASLAQKARKVLQKDWVRYFRKEVSPQWNQTVAYLWMSGTDTTQKDKPPQLTNQDFSSCCYFQILHKYLSLLFTKVCFPATRNTCLQNNNPTSADKDHTPLRDSQYFSKKLIFFLSFHKPFLCAKQL